MKILCTCENIIIDQTDYLNYKGYIISDAEWIDFWDSIDERINSGRPSKDNDENIQLEMQKVFKNAWECTKCGNLFIEGTNGEILEYTSDNKKYNKVLNKIE